MGGHKMSFVRFVMALAMGAMAMVLAVALIGFVAYGGLVLFRDLVNYGISNEDIATGAIVTNTMLQSIWFTVYVMTKPDS
jgi:hypothetical protein